MVEAVGDDLVHDQSGVVGAGKKKLAKLTVPGVGVLIDELRDDGAGARTVQYVHATLRAALEHAYREELVTRNVAKDGASRAAKA